MLPIDILVAMAERFVADAGPFHYEIRLVNGVWEWEVLNEGSVDGRGKAVTLEAAKTQSVVCSGRAPDEWKHVSNEIGAHATAGDLHIDIRWVNNRWEWEVSKFKHHELLNHDRADSLELAKAAALKAAGLEAAAWTDIA